MNFEFFIGKRVFSRDKTSLSGPFVKIAVISIALGISAMIISMAIVTGFQKEIRDKVTGFGSHIFISNYDVNASYEPKPMDTALDFTESLRRLPGVKHLQFVAAKAGIVKTENQIEGVVFKGVGPDFDWSFLRSRITAGRPIQLSNHAVTHEVIISRHLSDRLNIKTGDSLRIYFIVGGEMMPRGRKLAVTGIYSTGLEDYDKTYVIGDINNIRKLNGWTPRQAAGIEISIADFREIEEMTEAVSGIAGYEFETRSIVEMQPQIFQWLSLHDMNVIIIIALMIIVAGITMISTILILILEKTTLIGILKALGSRDISIRKIFIYNASMIILKGLLWGNLIAVSLCLLQQKTGLIKLNEESYYVPAIPVNLNLLHILAFNLGTLLICSFILIIPAMIIARISPVRTLRFS